MTEEMDQRGPGCETGKDWPNNFILCMVWVNWSLNKEGSGAFMICSYVEMKGVWGGRREENGGKEEKREREQKLWATVTATRRK